MKQCVSDMVHIVMYYYQTFKNRKVSSIFNITALQTFIILLNIIFFYIRLYIFWGFSIWIPRHHRIPPKETVKEEDTPPAAASDLTSEPEGAQAPPTEGQEDARGAYPPPGSLSGEMITFDMGPLALGPRRVHLALMYEW